MIYDNLWRLIIAPCVAKALLLLGCKKRNISPLFLVGSLSSTTFWTGTWTSAQGCWNMLTAEAHLVIWRNAAATSTSRRLERSHKPHVFIRPLLTLMHQKSALSRASSRIQAAVEDCTYTHDSKDSSFLSHYAYTLGNPGVILTYFNCGDPWDKGVTWCNWVHG